MSPPDWPGVEHRYHELSTGVRAHVAHAGPEDAPPLLALHGFPQHWYEWRRVIDALAGEFRVLAMDTRGLGWSGPPRTATTARRGSPTTPSRCSTTSGSSAPVLLGHDWGGWVGFIAALTAAPERWTGYVATGIPHPWQPPSARCCARSRGRSTSRRSPRRSSARGSSRGSCRRSCASAGATRSTYDDAAEEIYAATYREPARAEAASRYYRHFLIARGAARRAPGRPDGPDEAALRHARAAGSAPAPRASSDAASVDPRGLRALRARGAACSRSPRPSATCAVSATSSRMRVWSSSSAVRQARRQVEDVGTPDEAVVHHSLTCRR